MAFTQEDLEKAERKAATLVESWAQGDRQVRHTVDAAIRQVEFIRQALATQNVRRQRVTYASMTRD